MRLTFAAFALAPLFACARPEPPSSISASPSSVATLLDAAAEAAVLEAGGPDQAAASPTVDASVRSEPPKAGVDPATLPQTRDKPEASGAAFDGRVAALWEAIAKDDPDRAMPFFFPLAAYEQVKDVSNPSRDWKYRLVAAYVRDVHDLHKRLGSDPSGARLVSMEIGPSPRWVEPHEEYNKIGYYRVFGTKLKWEGHDGTPHSFDIKSLISWRGEWYVVHLSAIK
jgi:hypothetical protein